MTATIIHVRSHPRNKPYANARAKTTARLKAEVDAKLDRQIADAFRTFAINVWRAEKAGKL